MHNDEKTPLKEEAVYKIQQFKTWPFDGYNFCSYQNIATEKPELMGFDRDKIHLVYI